jgi:hypothetical protein
MRITHGIWTSLLRRERRSFLLVLLALILVSFALSPMARAVTPAPDGGYPNFNTAEGTEALQNLTRGNDNTAIGFQALFSNTTGQVNTAIGSLALIGNTTGSDNTATGFEALNSNTTGNSNTATGQGALASNTIGSENTAAGLSRAVKAQSPVTARSSRREGHAVRSRLDNVAFAVAFGRQRSNASHLG